MQRLAPFFCILKKARKKQDRSRLQWCKLWRVVMTKKESRDKKKSKETPEFLYHYLSLGRLISILKNRQLCFCNPDYWEDKNDAYYAKMATPQNKVVGVICFTNKKEMCTHWKTFASKGIGVKLTFKFDELLESIKKNTEVDGIFLSHFVCYKSRKDVLKANISELDKKYWPLFIKKKAYKNEREYRFACIVDAKMKEFGKIVCPQKIPLSCISRITISPYVQKSVAHDVIKLLKAYIESLDADKKFLNIEIQRSTMMFDREWLKVGHKLANLTRKSEPNLKENEK